MAYWKCTFAGYKSCYAYHLVQFLFLITTESDILLRKNRESSYTKNCHYLLVNNLVANILKINSQIIITFSWFKQRLRKDWSYRSNKSLVSHWAHLLVICITCARRIVIAEAHSWNNTCAATIDRSCRWRTEIALQ